MKNKRKISLAIAVIMSAAMFNFNVSASELTTFYVAPDGDDSGDGSINSPFATIEGARDAIRALKEEQGELPEGGVCVYFREGVYSMHDGVEFTEEDSGTADAPITYRPYKNEKVSFIGGLKLDVKDFRRVADQSVLERIYDRDARECIYQYDLSVFDDFEYGKIYKSGESGNMPNELVVDGKVMTIARYPNVTASGDDQFEKLASVVNENLDGNKCAFTIADSSRANNWKTADDVCLVANWTYLWSTTYDTLDSVKNGVITAARNSNSTISGSARFYALNLLEEIDQPEEFYIDKENEILYFYPPVNSTSESDIYISTLRDTMFNINGASYLTFRGFEIPCSRGGAFSIKDGEHNLVAYCDIRNLGGRAVTISSGKYNGAVGNFVSMCNGGIDVGGGDRNTLEPGYNYAENNETEKFSRITKTYLGGVMISGCGNRLSNNEVHDGLHLGMQFSGNENLIEYNEFYDLLKSVDDSGGIYAGRTWMWRGNEITHNYFHDFYGSSGGVGLGCIYFDDSLSGNSVTKNIFYNVPGRGMWAEAGSDNNIENNIMVNVGTPIRYADRRNSTQTFAQMKEKEPTNKHVTSAAEVPYTSKIWLEKYPILKDIDNLPILSPNRVTIKNNVFVNSGSMSIDAGVSDDGDISNNISMDNPGFADLANADFTLTENAAVYSQLPDFEDVHFEKMGRYTERLNERVKDAIVLGIDRAGAKKDGNIIQIDSENDAVMPIIINNRTMVPVRFISESLGAEVSWNPDTKEIGVSYNNKSITMHVGNNVMTVDGEEVILDEAPTIKENRTLIPLRAVAEALEKQVFWDDKGLIVISDVQNIFDSENDAYLIDDLLRQINLR